MTYTQLRKLAYYSIKPLLPRSLQISLRRARVRLKARRAADTWPIDPRAGAAPPGWLGWPEGRSFALVLTHDVESCRGLSRCGRLWRAENEQGFVSSFNFIPEKYTLPRQLHDELVASGFEIGVHDLRHDGRLFSSEKAFLQRVHAINGYLAGWGAVGFRAGSMFHNLDWMHRVKIQYDSSTFDTDPFEPQPDGLGTVFPRWIRNGAGDGGYVELPYTLPQDMTLFILLRHRDPRLWKEKLAWIARCGGMALLVSHPDYMSWGSEKRRVDEYPFELYREFLDHVRREYKGQYWNAPPCEVARYWKRTMATRPDAR